jgi:hypothetical protein
MFRSTVIVRRRLRVKRPGCRHIHDPPAPRSSVIPNG